MPQLGQIFLDQKIETILNNILSDISRLTQHDLLTRDKDQIKESMFSKYPELPRIDFDNIVTLPVREEKQVVKTQFLDRFYEESHYICTFKFPISDKDEILRTVPKVYEPTPSIFDYTVLTDAILLTIKVPSRNSNDKIKQEADKIKEKFSRYLKEHILRVSNDLTRSHHRFSTLVSNSVEAQLNKIKKTQELGEILGVTNIDTNGELARSNEIIINKVDPIQSTKDSNKSAGGYYLSDLIANEIIKTISFLGRGMERKPSLYKNKDEEGIRDLFAFVLENRFQRTSVTTETFSKKGKTDLLIKSDNDQVVFIAEFKIWRGFRSFKDAIKQLLGYCTWREKALLFVIYEKNKLNRVLSEIKSHENYSNDVGDGHFRFCSFLSDDSDIKLYFDVLVFHCPQLA